ncbi:Serine phosphatase RsbU, regulator of sigma subunit [Anaerosphaera aminiphila DSM 21120]|uniref:Serine phosphatase RsbU, regulator of sigma subunit n=1 Tax=Anaerosphaera aminiphila DSM 21120 TaxID=1120995 RepID=A0A1M5R8B8_9FIRM|nr:SpoIIE family protein phosphatase [Anaerosphaera aminiphila]SHH22597.1 Serine phosphatase RsbU, regulator of sigma subunit [Anaerosphaera aminiphila DSM 21120]
MSFVYKEDIFNNAKLNSQALNSIADLIRVLNANNEVIFVNKAMDEALNCEVGKFGDFTISSDITRRTIETAEIIQREELLCGNYFSVKCSPIFGEYGEIVGAVEVFRNITMQKSLQKEIVDKNKELTEEMISAQKIQNSLLPERGFFNNISVDYFYKPSNILSGDMFDIFKINEDNIGIYMADSVGHGFAASMITMFIRIIIRNISSYKLLSPSKTLSEVAKKFATLNLDIELYFTCFYGVYNKKLSKFTFSNAGHFPAPILFQEDGEIELESSGYPITRYFKNVKYEDNSVKIDNFDKILLMTDGVVDAQNKRKKNYGSDQVLNIIRDNSIDELKILEDDIDNFIKGKQKDDMTALLLKVW